MQVVDTLDRGGAERVAVTMANLLDADRYTPYLCTTRRNGPLLSELAPHVKHFCLNRKGRFDTGGIRRMVELINNEQIDILHAHGSSLFVSRIAARMAGKASVIWHDHYGGADWSHRTKWLYRWATAGANVIAVNDSLAKWSREVLHVPSNKVWYVPNWVEDKCGELLSMNLPGGEGMRAICVANLRAQKDHITLLEAIRIAKKSVPFVHLLLVGEPSEPRYADYVVSQIKSLGIEKNVTYLGPREDVMAILRVCDVGLLSSVSEGLPLALLEYGLAGLAVITTNVGQCSEVLADGRVGVLVPPSRPESFAAALVELLNSPERRKQLGQNFRDHVLANFDAQPALQRITAIYQQTLQQRVS